MKSQSNARSTPSHARKQRCSGCATHDLRRRLSQVHGTRNTQCKVRHHGYAPANAPRSPAPPIAALIDLPVEDVGGTSFQVVKARKRTERSGKRTARVSMAHSPTETRAQRTRNANEESCSSTSHGARHVVVVTPEFSNGVLCVLEHSRNASCGAAKVDQARARASAKAGRQTPRHSQKEHLCCCE